MPFPNGSPQRDEGQGRPGADVHLAGRPQSAQSDLPKRHALVEQEINDSIIQILGVTGDAANVIPNEIDFAKKTNLFLIAAIETAPAAEKGDVEKLCNKIMAQNNDRQVMAHNSFEPAANDGVQFKRTTAKGKIRKDDPLWSKQKFEQSYKALQDIRQELTEFRPRLTASINKEGNTQILQHYLSRPASSLYYMSQAVDLSTTIQRDTPLPLKQSEIDRQKK
jgi:hypothetical protein